MSKRNAPLRNPKIGWPIAILMLGFAIYRYIEHYVYGVPMPSWRFWINAAILIYGIYLMVDLILQRTRREE